MDVARVESFLFWSDGHKRSFVVTKQDIYIPGEDRQQCKLV